MPVDQTPDKGVPDVPKVNFRKLRPCLKKETAYPSPPRNIWAPVQEPAVQGPPGPEIGPVGTFPVGSAPFPTATSVQFPTVPPTTQEVSGISAGFGDSIPPESSIIPEEVVDSGNFDERAVCEGWIAGFRTPLPNSIVPPNSIPREFPGSSPCINNRNIESTVPSTLSSCSSSWGNSISDTGAGFRNVATSVSTNRGATGGGGLNPNSVVQSGFSTSGRVPSVNISNHIQTIASKEFIFPSYSRINDYATPTKQILEVKLDHGNVNFDDRQRVLYVVSTCNIQSSGVFGKSSLQEGLSSSIFTPRTVDSRFSETQAAKYTAERIQEGDFYINSHNIHDSVGVLMGLEISFRNKSQYNNGEDVVLSDLDPLITAKELKNRVAAYMGILDEKVALLKEHGEGEYEITEPSEWVFMHASALADLEGSKEFSSLMQQSGELISPRGDRKSTIDGASSRGLTNSSSSSSGITNAETDCYCEDFNENVGGARNTRRKLEAKTKSKKSYEEHGFSTGSKDSATGEKIAAVAGAGHGGNDAENEDAYSSSSMDETYGVPIPSVPPMGILQPNKRHKSKPSTIFVSGQDSANDVGGGDHVDVAQSKLREKILKHPGGCPKVSILITEFACAPRVEREIDFVEADIFSRKSSKTASDAGSVGSTIASSAIPKPLKYRPPNTVFLNIYHVQFGGNVWKFSFAPLNRMLKNVLGWENMGAFHMGVEVYGDEWQYGYCAKGTGISRIRPRLSRDHQYFESIPMGQTPLKRKEIIETAKSKQLSNSWLGCLYDLNSKNCVDFAVQLCKILQVSEVPPSFGALVKSLPSFGQLPISSRSNSSNASVSNAHSVTINPRTTV